MRNLHQLFDWQYIGQIISGDFTKFCGLLRIYELYIDNAISYTVQTKMLKASINLKKTTKLMLAYAYAKVYGDLEKKTL